MMGQEHDNPAPTEIARVGEPAPGPMPRRRRDPAALWRAIAGMAIALALASAIVMLEFASRAMRHADRMHRRAAALSERVTHLESELAAERTQVAAARRNLAAAQSLLRLLRAPDATMVALAPVSPPPSLIASSRMARGGAGNLADGGARAGAPRLPAAMLVLAPREGRAVLMVAGLVPPGEDASFALWWSAARAGTHGAPTRAASFRTAADGSAIVTAALSADALSAEMAAATVTLERGDAQGARPVASSATQGDAVRAAAGPVLLRGTFRR